jgi:hypothetical protein
LKNSKHSSSKDNQEARIEAKRALKILHHDKWFHKILEVTKSNTNYGFADNAIYTTVSSLRIQKKVLIVTQDKTLATDLRKLNDLDSQRGRYVMVYRLNPNGELEENPGESGNYQSRNYGSNRSPSTSTNNRFHRGLFHKENAPKPVESHTAAPKVEENSPIIAADKRLMANLNNPNYPLDKKLSDIEDQLKAIAALPAGEKDKLSLAYTSEQLLQEKAKLSAPSPSLPKLTPAQAELAKMHHEYPLPPRPLPDLPVKPVVTEKPQEKLVEVKPQMKPIAPKKAWFEFGENPQTALTKAGSHDGIIFRDASVPYVPQIHGPYDLTSQDLNALASKVGLLKTGEGKEFPLGPLVAHVEKTDRDYKAWLEKPEPKVVSAPAPVSQPAPAVKPVEEKKAEKEEKPAKVPSKVGNRAPKKSEPQPESKSVSPLKEKKAATKKVAVKKAASPIKDEKAAPSVTAQDVNTAVPTGATLLVGVPTNEDKRGFIERRARREASPELSAVHSPKKVERSRAKITEKGTKPLKNDVPALDMAAILKEDKNLNAKINNPNYPIPQKIADLQAQKNRIKSLKAADQKPLLWSMAKINARLHQLSEKK